MPMGSMTAPDKICAPTSEPFSTTTTDVSGESCLSLIAAARPAGPAPTMTTSNSIASRPGTSVSLMARSLIRSEADIASFHPSHRLIGSSINPATVTPAAKHVRDLIAFYLDAGVDSAVGEEPVDYFADRPEPTASPPATKPAQSLLRDAPSSPTTPPKGTGNGTADVPPAPPPAPVVSPA